jgi:quinol monooxygenase YgiN
MFMRIVRGTPKSGKHEEFGKRWKSFFGPMIEQNSNVRHAYVGYDEDSNEIVAVTVWNERPDDSAMPPVSEMFGQKVQDLMAGPPKFEAYDVIESA